jgi:hypothetical protein
VPAAADCPDGRTREPVAWPWVLRPAPSRHGDTDHDLDVLPAAWNLREARGSLTSKTAGGVRVNEEVLSFPPQDVAARTGPTLTQVFHSSYRRLVVQLYGVVGDICEAEDLVQETFVRATAAGRRFLRADNHEAWLRTTAIRLHRNRWRKLRNFARIRHRLEQPTDMGGHCVLCRSGNDR